MKKVSGVLICLYIMTTGLLMRTGVTVSFPWVFLLVIGTIFIPLAYFISFGGLWMQKNLLQYPWLLRLSGILSGFFLLTVYRFDKPIVLIILWSICVAFLVVHVAKWRFATVKPLVAAFVSIELGFCVISNLNYMALQQVIGRLNDASLYRLDLAIYSFWFGRPMDYSGIFPLMNSNILFYLFQNAYFMLWLGAFLVFFLISFKKESVSGFLYVLLGCYLIGLLIFLIYPTVGPCIYYPDSLRVEYQQTMAYHAMQAMAKGFQSVKQQSPNYTELGYFVAFPSLHVAVAVVIQYFLRNYKIHFWIFLPICLAVIVSIFYLGFHYFIDAPAGVLLAFAIIFLLRCTGQGWQKKQSGSGLHF